MLVKLNHTKIPGLSKSWKFQDESRTFQDFKEGVGNRNLYIKTQA